MATGQVTFSPNTYAGQPMAGYLATSLLGGNTIERGLMTVIPNVKKRKVLRGISKTTAFQDPSCAFNGAGNNLAVGEKYLDPVKYEIQEEMCFDDLVTSWEADQLRAGSLNDYEPTMELSDWWVQRTMEETQNLNDKLYWLGKGSDATAFTFTDSYDGMLATIEAGSDVTKIDLSDEIAITGISQATQGVVTVGATTNLAVGDIITFKGVVGMTEINDLEGQILALTSTTFTVNIDTSGFTAYVSGGTANYINASNVIDVLTQVYALIPDALRLKNDLKIYVPYHVERSYKIAQAEVSNGAGSYFVGERSLDFLGHVLEPMPYFQANSVLVARVSNLFLGVDLLSDEQTIRTTDMREVTNDDLVRLKASMKSDVNYYFGAEILWNRVA